MLMGADVDLRFAHEACATSRPDLDDTDGAGPENLNLNEPENTVCRVGVDYWDDHGFRPSDATARIYVYGSLVYEATTTLENHAMWDVARIHWPPGTVEPVSGPEGKLEITPNYQSSFFFQP